MDLWILDANFSPLGIVDTATSIIWSNRYRQCGDFEIYAPASIETMDLLLAGRYVMRRDDEMLGTIEHIDIKTDVENGDYILTSGRCTRIILDRRIVWEQTVINDTVENAMRRLVTENFISPKDMARKHSKIALAAAHGYTDTVRIQYTGTNILTAIEELCATKNYGFKMLLQDGKLHVDFFKPVDRSMSQSENPRVVFSEDYNNLATTTYTRDESNYKNYVVVAGEGEGTARRRAEIQGGSFLLGDDRREMYVDARDISSNDGEITDDEYTTLLKERGREALSEAVIVQSMEGTIEPLQMYEYKKDYFLGDIVTVVNKYGVQLDTQVLEVVEVWDESGYTCTPTFG